MTQKKISILVPMYNESEVIPFFFTTIEKELTQLDLEYEIICVNDGSRDNTLQQLTEYAAKDSRIKVVSFSRNFGKEAAMTAALEYSSGDAVIPIDADLQDPPELIHEMIAEWREGFDVVYAKRSSRVTDSLIKRQTAGWFYALFNRMSETDIPRNVGDYRLMDRKVVEAIKKLPEKVRFMKGLFSWPGFNSTTVEYERQKRAEGGTKFNYWNLWNFAISGITSFSTLPIRIGTYLGLMIASISFCYGFYIITKTLLFGRDAPGYASIMVVMLFLGGVQLFFMGLMGEYIGRIYKEVKNRPLYVVEREIGFNND
ncbi:MAG: glycosyltransferase [Gammaproteobacteria bacterium]|nr:glycosyltransferase [Gammaproteobacteria bacterium]